VAFGEGPSLYVRLGGKPGVQRLSESFVRRLRADASLWRTQKMREYKARVPEDQASRALAQRICEVSRDGCSPLKEALPPIPQGVRLDPLDWLQISTHAEHAMIDAKVPTRERLEVIQLLIRAR